MFMRPLGGTPPPPHPSEVGGVNNKKAGSEHLGLPIFKDASEACGIATREQGDVGTGYTWNFVCTSGPRRGSGPRSPGRPPYQASFAFVSSSILPLSA